MTSRKFKKSIHRRPKAEPALRPVRIRPNPIAGLRERVEAGDVLTRRLWSTVAVAALTRR